MKRMISLLTLILILCLSAAAFAAETTPFFVTINHKQIVFPSSGSDLRNLLPDAMWDPWYEDDAETGVLGLYGNVSIDGIAAEEVTMQVDRNNSAGEPRLTLVSATLPTGDNCIAAFRNGLEVLTALYGQPDYDPFGADCVRIYQQSGTLSATWTTGQMTISLDMNRMFNETLTLDYIYLLNYDAADLD